MVSDRGALEPVLILLGLGLATTSLAIAAIFGVLVARERLQGAADLAALAVASQGAPMDPADTGSAADSDAGPDVTADRGTAAACAIADVVARRNGALLVGCSVEQGDVRVEVRLPRPDRGLLHLVPEAALRARAHAGFADLPQAA